MVEWILVLTLSTGAGGGAAIQTVGAFQTIGECSVAGGTWVNNKPNGAMVRDYVCLKRTKAPAPGQSEAPPPAPVESVNTSIHSTIRDPFH